MRKWEKGQLFSRYDNYFVFDNCASKVNFVYI